MASLSPALLGHLQNDKTSVVIAHENNVPFIAYLGSSLGDGSFDTYLLRHGVMGGGLDKEIFPFLYAEPQRGWMGKPGIQLRHLGSPVLSTSFALHEYTTTSSIAALVLRDTQLHVDINVRIELHDSGVVVLDASVINNSSEQLHVDVCDITIPLGPQCKELLTLGGCHAMEAIEHRHVWDRSRIAVDNRTGRTSHEQMGVVFAGTPHFTEQSGEVWGVHCAWSGNFSLHCDSLTTRHRVVQVGELLQPSEVVLEPNDTYDMPSVVVGYSSTGINGVSQQFHSFVRHNHSNIFRPVMLNTWEAVYFQHDLDTLKALADQGAKVGIERFVLDDGWFHSRRNDTAGLGDWWVDRDVWPDGLTPLITHVRSLGMEFGLWFEPEMVNPDSDLFRAHPEWALDGQQQAPLLGRHQLVLNLALAPVRDYLFAHISDLLSTHEIAYVKWDHNRPLVGGAAHDQTRGVYALFDRLTNAFPHVQFESCASGGGRIDMGIAAYVERFWTSDSIDALDRLTIQKGVSKLIPLEMLGSHIGSPICHTTGRRHALSFRAATAMFGWMGVEWNLLSLTDREREHLTSAIAMYKAFRPLMHAGTYVRCDHPDASMHVHGVIASDASQMLLSASRISNGPTVNSDPLKFPGLDAQTMYEVTRVDNGNPRWALHRELPTWLHETVRINGAQLSLVGLPCPPLLPESTLLIHVSKVNS